MLLKYNPLLLIALLAGGALLQPAHSQSAPAPAAPHNEAAVAAAQRFVTRYDQANPGELYDEELSQTFKALMARDTFIQQTGFTRVQSGGLALGREFIGAQAFQQTPTGNRGNYQYVRFRTRYPNGLVFQDVYLEEVAGSWKVMGFYMLPAPQQ